MDLGTLLHHIDHHMYPTTAPFLADVALIPESWAQYYEVRRSNYATTAFPLCSIL